jgi:hypothetical protein
MHVRTVPPALLLKAMSRENHGTDEMSAILLASQCTYVSSVRVATVWQLALLPALHAPSGCSLCYTNL